ncbi:Scarecrow-like protein 28 [Apostasia shenzhenica]|uniref:Scarecrow-like protein 28 n=1 Tax=Apostasia shenzhenica TaxID=1088818 RepID=A0A2I0B1H0_9ASPA|nr:Scarecrow-like protein 28 [Apostasia shenzhenica]
MLAGYQIQEYTMSTQRLDLPCSFSRKEAARVSLTFEKKSESRSSCSLRPNPVLPSSSAIVAQTASWESRREREGELWKKGRSLKRFIHDSGTFEDSCLDRLKRKKTCGGGGDDNGDFSLPLPVQHPSAEDEEEEDKVSFLPASTEGALIQFQTGEANSGSSSSSGSHGSSPKLKEESSEKKVAIDSTRAEHEAHELLNLLVECAQSISSSNHPAASFFLARLGELASPAGSPIHRVAAYFTEALAIRASNLWPHVFCIAPPAQLTELIAGDDEAMAFRLLNNFSPIPKFIHFTLNERLLRAFEGKDRVHIIDLDIKQGLQWPGFFHSLASRPEPPTHVRITGIGQSKQELQATGARLAGIAGNLNLPFEFHWVVDRLEDVRLWMLHVKEREFVAVNCVLQLHRLLFDEKNLMGLLGLIRSTNPAIIVLAEVEAEHNEQRWEKRFATALQYYSALFDMIDSSFQGDDSPSRSKIEEMFARKMRNIIACEGVERLERHESFRSWRRMLEDGGFRSAGFNDRERIQSNILLKMYQSGTNYIVAKEEDDRYDGISLKWMDQPLYTVSAWAAAMDIAGSSSVSQPG